MQCWVVLVGVLALAVPHAANGHNIVYLIADEMDGRVLDPTSPLSQVPDMPRLTALGAAGTAFINNYCASPQCVPSRSSTFTGRHVHRINTWNNGQGLCVTWDGYTCVEQGNATYWDAFVARLATAGYNVSLHGKVDTGGGMGGGFHGTSDAVASYSRAANITKPQKPDPRSLVHASQPQPKAGDWRTIDTCVQEIRARAAANDTTPWVLYCSVSAPHPPYDTNSTYSKRVNATALHATLPTWQPLADMHPIDVYQTLSKAVVYNSMPAYTTDDIAALRRAYFAMCTEVDDMFGTVMDALTAAGYTDDNTYVLFTSDHGEAALSHRQIWKNSAYESTARVPLVVRGPGIAAGQTVSVPTSSLDLYPTLMDMAATATPPGLDGTSLLPLMDGRHAAGAASRPDFVVAQYHSRMSSTGWFMVRHGAWKLVTYGLTPPYEHTPPQLFNLEADPWELTNVAAAANNSAVVHALTQRLASVLDSAAVDATAKANDVEKFKAWQAAAGSKWPAALAKLYAGMAGDAGKLQPLDDSDFAKVRTWLGQ